MALPVFPLITAGGAFNCGNTVAGACMVTSCGDGSLTYILIGDSAGTSDSDLTLIGVLRDCGEDYLPCFDLPL